jgi:hypothetical protein
MTPATKAALFLADKAGINVPQPVRMLADPIGSLIGAVAPRVNEALGAAPGTVEAVANPKGFLKDLAKDVGKDYLRDKSDIPEEDRSFSSSGNGGYDKLALNTYSDDTGEFKRGGKVKSKSSFKQAPKISTASRRGDGIAQRGKTRGRML